MRQRNPGPHPLILPTLDPPRQVEEGEEIDHPELLAGFEPVDPADSPAASDPPADSAEEETDPGGDEDTPPPKTKSRARSGRGDSPEGATTR